jgi:acetyltransferase
VAKDEESAVQAATTLGYPVVVKIHSETITHKTDVGGVRLDLPDAEAVRLAFRAIQESARERGLQDAFLGVAVQPMMSRSGYELIIGSSQDRQLGPVLLFGTGGRLVEVYKDRALALPPLNTTLARRMMEQTRIYAALKGAHGQPPADIEWLEELLVRFSRLVVEQPWIKEIDINPLLVSSEQTIALDARMVLFNSEMEERDLPSSAIRPYPVQHISSWIAKDGTQIEIRPIRPEDEPKMVEFHRTLSDETVHFRYFHMVDLGSRVDHDRLARMCFIDYDREMALVAEQQTPEEQKGHILGVGRLRRKHNANEAEFAIVISDAFQSVGLGTELLNRLIDIGRQEKLDRITATTLIDNYSMQRIFKNRGFDLRKQTDEGLVKAALRILPAEE